MAEAPVSNLTCGANTGGRSIIDPDMIIQAMEVLCPLGSDASVAVGEGRWDGIWGILGMLTGAAAYTEVFPYLKLWFMYIIKLKHLRLSVLITSHCHLSRT